MSLEFLKLVGFESDPFASTNAADEPLIDQYFVEPPFFPAVIGDPSSPKSNIVFAPRGGGKTAQKIMIEQKSRQTGTFICISYDRFPIEGVKANAIVTAEYHLTNITRILFIALLILIQDGKIDGEKLNEFEKRLIVTLSRELFGNITSEKFKESLDSVKSFGDKASDIWTKYGSSVITIFNAIAAKYELGKIDIEVKGYQKLDETYRFKFESVADIIVNNGFDSIYILVDRVDSYIK